jgi:hypothetical protein
MRPTGQYRTRVLAFLKFRQHATDKEVAKFIGIAWQTAHHYLDMLCKDGEAHRTRTYNPKGTWLITFNYGPGTPEAGFDSRVTVKTWAPLRVVDPWMLPRAFFQGAHL